MANTVSCQQCDSPVKKTLLLIFLYALLTGCAIPVHKIKISTPLTNSPRENITVIDNRLDTQVYMTGISYAGTHIYTYEMEPEISVALHRYITLELGEHFVNKDVTINIESLDIKNNIGFGKADKITCIIGSTVLVAYNNSKLIKTLSRNNENKSPLVTTVGKLIINQCIADHSRDISSFIKSNN